MDPCNGFLLFSNFNVVSVSLRYILQSVIALDAYSTLHKLTILCFILNKKRTKPLKTERELKISVCYVLIMCKEHKAFSLELHGSKSNNLEGECSHSILSMRK